MSAGMLNAMRGAASQAQAAIARTRVGTVSAYNPDTYSAKVMLQPEGVETGWIPIKTLWVGNGWGMQAGPTIGDLVTIQFQEGDQNAGVVLGGMFNVEDRPMPVPSGEMWMQDASGSCVKFIAGGIVRIEAATALETAAPAWNHTGPLNLTGLMTVIGAIRATADITDFYLSGSPYSMRSFRILYNSHTHHENDVGGETNQPTQQA